MTTPKYKKQPNTDCFAWNSENCICNALLRAECMIGKCRFYKTKEQNEKEKIKCAQRLGLLKKYKLKK